MRILLVGAGGVGSALAKIAARRDFFSALHVTDYELGAAQHVVAEAADPRYTAGKLDAGDESAVLAAIREHRADVVMNAVDPRFVMPVFRAALAGGAHYLDMAMSLSKPHPEKPYELHRRQARRRAVRPRRAVARARPAGPRRNGC